MSDAATEVFDQFITPYDDPSDYGYAILYNVLNLASCFLIDIPKISHNNWKTSRILNMLIDRNAPYEIVQLAIALKLGCPAENIALKEGTLKISGIKKGGARELRNLIKLISESSLSDTIEILDLSSNHVFSHADERLNTLSIDKNGLLIDYLKQFKNLKKIILSDNPICDPTPLESLLKSSRNLESKLQTIVLKETYTSKFHPFNVKFIQTLRQRGGTGSIVCGTTAPIKPRHFDLSPEEKKNIFDYLCGCLKDWWQSGERDYIEGTSISYCDLIASFVEQLGENFWPESLAERRSLLERIFVKEGDSAIDELFDVLNGCNQHRQNMYESQQPRKMKEKTRKTIRPVKIAGEHATASMSGKERSKDPGKNEQTVAGKKNAWIPVKEAAFKLAFVLKHDSLLIGISPENLGFAPNPITKRPIIVSNPYCLTSLKISCDLSRTSLAFLSNFSGAYTIRIFDESTKRFLGNLKFNEVGIYLQGEDLCCKHQDNEEFNISQNETFKEFIENNLRDRKFIHRLKTAIQTKVALSLQDTGSLILSASRIGYILPGLVKLDLSHARLTSIASLPIMESLVTLNLSYNELTNLDDFYQPIENTREEVYKFPRLRGLDLKNNLISLTEESYEKRFKRHFNTLLALEISHNQLEFVPMMDKKWFEINPKIQKHLSIHSNNIPIKHLHKLYNWDFCASDPIDEWKRKPPPCNSLKFYWQDDQICCRLYGQADTMLLPSEKLADFGLQNLGVQTSVFLNIQIVPDLTTQDKENLITFIAHFNPAYLNTNFLRVAPQIGKR